MFRREKNLRYAIRKLAVGAASVAVGMTFAIGGALPAVHADTVSKPISFEYRLEDELSDHERSLITQQLPSQQVDAHDVYYVVYRPTTGQLPYTGVSAFDNLLALSGVAFIVLGVALAKKHKKGLVVSVLLLSAGGQLLTGPTAQAVGDSVLAHLNQTFQLEVGADLPDRAISIPGYQFVGYIALDTVADTQYVKDEHVAEAIQKPDQPNVDTGVQPSGPAQPVPSVQPSVPAQPVPSVQPAVPAQPVPSIQPAVPVQPALPIITYETVTEVLPFTVTPVDDNQLPVGQHVDDVTGVDGEKRTEYRITTHPDGRVEREVANVAERPAVNVTRRVGTKLPDNVRVETVTLPYRVVYVDDADLPAGQEEELNPGTDGQARLTYVSGVLTQEERLVEPVDKRIRKGTKVVPGTTPAPVVRTEVVTLAFGIDYEDDATLLAGTEEVKRDGTNGQQQVTYTDGVITKEETLVPAQNKVIRRGTKPAPVVRTEVVETDFGTDYEDDANLPAGQLELVRDGVKGKKRITYTDDVVTQEEVLAQPQNKLMRRGTKQIDKSRLQAMLAEALTKAETDYEAPSYRMLAGEREKAALMLADNAASQDDVDALVQSLERAIAALVPVADVLTKTELPTVYVADNSIPFGQTQEEAGRPKVVNQHGHVIDAGQAKTVKVGTQPTVTTREVDFQDIVTPDDQLLKGKTTIVKPGEKGLEQTTQTYTVDPNTGQVSLNTPTVVMVKPVVNQETKLGTKEPQKPTINLVKVTEDDWQRRVTAQHTVQDADQTFVKAILNVYDKASQTLVKTIDMATGYETLIDNLQYDTPYELETVLVYDLGAGPVEEVQANRAEFELELKQIEIKDIDSLTLYQHKNGETKALRNLSELPQDVSSYFVKVASDQFRDMLLPVTAIKAVQVAGQDAYEVTASVPELVQDLDAGQASTYARDFRFTIQKGAAAETDVYLHFKDLYEAMKLNPNGNFILGADMYAEDVVPGVADLSYIRDAFKGTLSGTHAGKAYAIYGLTLPLFTNLEGRVQDLDLKEVKIDTIADRTGALAKDAKGATITNVAAQGEVNGRRTVGGLVGKAIETTFTNVAFDGKVTADNTLLTGENFVGGIVGRMENGTMQKAAVDVAMDVHAFGGNHRTGAVIGSFFANTQLTLSDLYAKGTINNRATSRDGASGLVGSIWRYGRLERAITEVQVTNGVYIHGDTNHTGANIDRSSVFAVTGVATATTQDRWARFTTPEHAQELVTSFGITATAGDTHNPFRNNTLVTDYLALPNASADRAIAYDNIAKLMPFYNKEIIVKYGNKVGLVDKLNTSRLLSVTPMKDKTVVSDVFAEQGHINQIMLYFEDGSLVYMPVRFLEHFRNEQVAEYTINGTGLIYTPEQFLSGYDSLINRVSQAIKDVVYDSIATADALQVTLTKREIDDKKKANTALSEEEVVNLLKQERMQQLYLEEAVAKVKADLPSLLRKMLATDKSINTHTGAVEDHLVDYITDNKEKILFGLAYMQRWYNINFGEMNVQDLATFNQDFFGKDVETMEWLVSLGELGQSGLKISNNVRTYSRAMSGNTGLRGLFDYFTKNRELFTAETSDSDWFKKTTKAYIVEMSSTEDGLKDANISVYERFKAGSSAPYVLPLLTAREGIFMVSNQTSVTMGMFDRYMDMTLAESNPTQYQSEFARIKALVDKQAILQRDHFDFWYRVANADVKGRLARFADFIPTWDGYATRDGWLTPTKANAAMRDFFLPIEAYYGNNGSGAYANGSLVRFVSDRVLDDYGSSVFTHEMVHNLDGRVYLGGNGRRNNGGAELFALGMLQTPSGFNNINFGINTMFDYTAQKDSTARVHNVSPERFETTADLDQYIKRMFDVVHTLDNAEAEVILAMDDAKKLNFLNQFTTTQTKWMAEIERHEVRAGVTLNTMADLVNNEILSKRFGTGAADVYNFRVNGYWQVAMFSPIFGVGENPNGTAGDLLFRRMAYELFAYKGYQEGFLPYASNMLQKKAEAAGHTTVTDDFVINEVSKGQYQTMKAFKIARYQDNLAQAANLKTITIRYNNRDVVIDSYDKMKELISTALETDLRNQNTPRLRNREILNLKLAIYNAYLRMTDDFRDSIYK